MKLIVGLGNPGKKYQKTRHNIGFRVLENLKSKIKNQTLSLQSKIILFKPQSFMNLSGDQVLKKLNFYHLGAKDLIVIYDDIDLLLGMIRVRHKGRSGGHKGVQSIIDRLKTNNFIRVRIGIGRPPEEMGAEEYVLENFNPAEEKVIQKTIDRAVEKVIELIR